MVTITLWKFTCLHVCNDYKGKVYYRFNRRTEKNALGGYSKTSRTSYIPPDEQNAPVKFQPVADFDFIFQCAQKVAQINYIYNLLVSSTFVRTVLEKKFLRTISTNWL